MARNFVKNGSQVFKKYLFCRYRSSDCYLSPSQIVSKMIGDREIVGYGKNSSYMYIDHPAFPFPAIRFLETTPDLLCLREKEKGDWRNLSTEEKRTLYRASFCQTYAEMMAPTGKWKSIIGFALMWVSAGMWLFLYNKWLYSTELPDTFTEERKKAQLERMLVLEVNPICGLASKWDYRNNKWK